MRWIVLLASIAMPVVAWLSQTGHLGPTNGEVSDRYPTLLVAAGYAFSIWGVIFLWDVIFAVSQLRRNPQPLDSARPWAAAGFLLTASWMPVFSNGAFVPALIIIWGSLICLLKATLITADSAATPAQRALHAAPLALHAGWLTLAAFLNTAQFVVAFKLLDVDNMLSWSAPLLAMAVALALWVNHRLRGNLAYAFAVLWGLVGVSVKQFGWPLPGASIIGGMAALAALIVVGQTVSLHLKRGRSTR